jgi:hypothetical protein
LLGYSAENDIKGLKCPFFIQLRHALTYANERAIKATLLKARMQYLDAISLPIDSLYIKAIQPLMRTSYQLDGIELR